ncbi:9209_t:CDS:2, partial [Gigaspora margarita]
WAPSLSLNDQHVHHRSVLTFVIDVLVHSNNVLQKLINTLLFHGELFYSLKQYDKALLYYDKVSEFDPFNLIASSFHGKVYYLLGQYYKAFLDLNKALDINPLDIATLLYRGEAYFNHDAFNGFDFTSMKQFSSKKFEINNITAIMLCGEEYSIRGHLDDTKKVI